MQFKQVIGQSAIKQRLIQSVRENHVSHAQLFLGPAGSGKLPLALAYAQYILCPNRTETDSCGVCPTCQKMQKLVHPDLHFVVPTAATKISACEQISFRFFVRLWQMVTVPFSWMWRTSRAICRCATRPRCCANST